MVNVLLIQIEFSNGWLFDMVFPPPPPPPSLWQPVLNGSATWRILWELRLGTHFHTLLCDAGQINLGSYESTIHTRCSALLFYISPDLHLLLLVQFYFAYCLKSIFNGLIAIPRFNVDSIIDSSVAHLDISDSKIWIFADHAGCPDVKAMPLVVVIIHELQTLRWTRISGFYSHEWKFESVHILILVYLYSSEIPFYLKSTMPLFYIGRLTWLQSF